MISFFFNAMTAPKPTLTLDASDNLASGLKYCFISFLKKFSSTHGVLHGVNPLLAFQTKKLIRVFLFEKELIWLNIVYDSPRKVKHSLCCAWSNKFSYSNKSLVMFWNCHHLKYFQILPNFSNRRDTFWIFQPPISTEF